jgi:hypothetical protein
MSSAHLVNQAPTHDQNVSLIAPVAFGNCVIFFSKASITLRRSVWGPFAKDPN